MNARTVLLAPMHASHCAMRWFSLALLVLCVGIAVVAAILAPPARWAWIAVGVYSALLFFLWAFFLSSTALLAADARVLRIPGMQRASARTGRLPRQTSNNPQTQGRGLADSRVSDCRPVVLIVVLVVRKTAGPIGA